MPRNERAASWTIHLAVRAKRVSSLVSSEPRPTDGVIQRNEATPLIAASVREDEILRLRVQNDTVFVPLHSVPRHGTSDIPTQEASRRLSRWDVGHEIPRLQARNDTFGVSVYSE